MRRLLPLLTVLPLTLALGACGGDDTNESGDGTDGAAADGADGSDGSDGSGATAEVSFYADVQPILQQHCVRCHQEGGLGPGDFTDPAVVTALAPAIVGAVESGRMPPPVSDPDCQDYVGSEYLSISDDSKQVLASWLDLDTPMGDPADAPDPVVIDTNLVAPDIVIEMPEPYAPTFSDDRNPGNEYRCFVVDPGEAAGQYITGLAPVIGAPELVHHIVLFTVDPDDLDEDYYDPQGFNCIDGMGGDSTDGMIAAWAPGMLPLELPDGTGIEVPESRLLVMQMHYFSNGTAPGEVFDQSAYAFHLSPSAAPAFVAPIGSYGFSIPAGDANYSHGGSLTNDFFGVDLVATFPHMHELGTEYDLRIQHEDGSETCLSQGGYDFNNQLTYQFREPIEFGVNDTLNWSCTWDNSEGTSDVGFGERTDEEMCYFFTVIAP